MVGCASGGMPMIYPRLVNRRLVRLRVGRTL